MAKLRVDKIAAPIVKDEFTGSVYFDGTGDYLSVGNASDADWAFGTDPFTVEHWIYWKSVGNGQLLSPGMGNETNAWYWQYYNSQLQWGTQGVASDLTYSFTPNANRWYHIAVSRDSANKMRFFIDGVEVASGTVTRNYVASASPLLIANGGAGYFTGYMSNVRVCKGHAVYDGNFTVPTRELEVHTGAKGVVFPAADNRTVLLACQDAYNPLTEATARHTITGAGHLGGVLGQELVTNGSFDSNSDWSNYVSPTTSEISTDQSYNGTNSWKIVADEALDGISQTFSSFTSVTGVKYVLSGYLYSSTGYARIRWRNGQDSGWLYDANVGNGSANVWQRFEVRVVESNGGSNMGVRLTANGSGTFYFDNISVTADIPVTDANPGLLRKTNITSTITETTGSVYFDGTGDYIKSSIDSEDFAFSGDFAMECWVQKSGNGAHADGIGNVIMMTGNASNNRNGIWISVTNAGSLVAKVAYDTSSWALEISGGTLSNGVWHHVALTRSGSTVRLFLDGAQQASGSNGTDITTTYSNAFSVGGQFNPAGSRHVNGYVSNARICKGHPVYTSNFIPPTRELEVHEGPDYDRTVLLACYDGENIFADKSGRHVIAAYGDRTSSPTPTATDSAIGITTVTPGLTREVDQVEGPTFGGGAGFVSENWLTLPKGTTAERMPNFATNAVTSGGTRAVYHSGETPTTSTYDTLEYLNIATLGSVNDFGNLTNQKLNQVACSSNTRGLFATGYTPSPASGNSFIDYVTIMSTGNAKDFGDLTFTTYVPDACSNQIRGFVAGGAAAPNYSGLDNIDYVTISTLGNGTDFGNLIDARHSLTGLASPTRGIFGAGQTNVNTIEYITIASTGNGSDFGDLLLGRAGCAGASSSIRGLFAGGYTATPAVRNIIEFITIATMGNSQDFGDLTAVRRFAGATSSTTRGVFIAGYNPSMTNTIDYVNIQTTGNAVDFGETINKTQSSACSNGHGGLG